MNLRRLLSIALVSLGAAVALAQEPVGGIRGSAWDKDFEVPLSKVRVTVIEAQLTTDTADDGSFVFERVPPGSYTLTLFKDGYGRTVMSSIVVIPGRLTDVRADLASEVIEMEELIVTGEDLLANSDLGLLEIRAAAVSMQDSISSELIRKAGASDVAGALKLVVGTSVVGGKYATVRGMSDRYTGTTLNGVRLPSADPRRRAVQVDLFPTGTIDSVNVTKTFTPELHGDFSGGGIDIRTKDIPDGFTLSASVSVEHDSNATGNDDFLTYDGGGVSRDAGDRGLPAEALQPLPPFPSFSFTPTPAQVAASAAYDRLVRAFDPTLGVSRDAPGPNTGFSLVAGDRFELGRQAVLGVLGAATYSRKYDFYDAGTNNSAAVSDPSQPITLTRPREDSRGVEDALLGALASVVLKPNPEDEIALRFVLNEGAEDEARLQVQSTGTDTAEINQSLHYTERRLVSMQLQGHHEVGLDAEDRAVELDWLLADSETTQEEPDVRFFRYVFDASSMSGTRPPNSTDAQNTRRIFRDVEEDNGQVRLDAAFPFRGLAEQDGKLRLGLYGDRSDRGYTQDSFTYVFPNQVGSFLNTAVRDNRARGTFQSTTPGELWTDVFHSPDRIGLATNRCPPNQPSNGCAATNQLLWVLTPVNNDVDYTGDQTIRALYAMAELPLPARLKAVFGARQESTRISIVPTSASGNVEVIEVQPGGDRAIVLVPQEQAQANIDDARLLPSVGLIWELSPQMTLRGTWSQTMARPTFRELAPVATEEFIFGDEFVGNPALQLARVINYDLRWEWFRRAGEVLAASVFAKDLTDPIELISFAAGGRSFIQPVNYETGSVSGFELEARLPLDAFAQGLGGFVFGANYTRLDSSVDVPLDERASLEPFGLAEESRQLQGQPADLLNLNLTWDGERSGTSAGVFYNRVGETLLTGAARGTEDGVPNVFEQPYDTLDVSVSRKVKAWGKTVTLGLRAKNLLQPDRVSLYRRPDGEEVVKTERVTALQIGFSAGFSW